MKMVDKYCYRVVWSEEDGEFVGLCAEFPSLSWLDKKSETAFNGIRKLVAKCVKEMRKQGEKVPDPIASKKYSGKFVMRIPPQLHRKLVMLAQESQMSLNRYLAARLAEL